MYCAKCNAYSPEGLGIQSCLACGGSLLESKQRNEPAAVHAIPAASMGSPSKKTSVSSKKGFFLTIDGFENQTIEMIPPSLFDSAKLLINGHPAPKDTSNSKAMRLKRSDGREVTATWKPKIWGVDTPDLLVDGNVVEVAKPLAWYEWLCVGLPIGLIGIGGMLGGMLGGVVVCFNMKIVRSAMQGWLKLVCCMALSLVTIIGFMAILLAVKK